MCSYRMVLVTALLLWSAIPNGARTLNSDAHRTSPVLYAPHTSSIGTRAYKAVLAALIMHGQDSATTLGARRALRDNLFDGAAEALSSHKTAVPGRTFAPAPEPGAALGPAPALINASPAAPAHTTALAAVAPATSAEDERDKAVPAFQVGSFLVQHADMIEPLEGGNGGHVIQAAKLAQQQLQAEATHWLEQQTKESSKTEPVDKAVSRLVTDLPQHFAQLPQDATHWLAQQSNQISQAEPVTDELSKLATDLPQDFAQLPQDVAETFAGFAGHLGTEALNASYYAEEFDSFLHKLQDPVAVQAGAQLFSNSPCLFSTNLGAVEASATGVSISPSLLSLGATGVNMAPQGMSISPALLSFGATGVNIAPQGLNIAPALIAVTPGHVAVNPQGGTISPVGLSVTAPAEEPAKPSQGRRLLRQSLFEGLAGAVTSLAAEAEAAASNLLGGALNAVTGQPDAPPASGPAQPATQEAAAGTNAAAANFTLPVALHGLGNWAALVGRMCQSGATTPEESSACLTHYFNHTNTLLESLADKYKDLKGGNISAALGKDFPKLEIKAPTFYAGSDNVINTNVAAVQLGATGFSFSPCAIPIGPVGVNISPTGVTISPTLISASATAVNVQPQGLNIAPSLIVVGPYDTTVAGQGLNVAPALITVSPTRTAINPVGPLKISDAAVTETLPALPVADERSR